MNTPSALFVDLYELSMAQVYLKRGMTGAAVFELVVRDLPEGWDYLIAAGLERALEFLESYRFSPDDLDYLRTLPQFEDGFLEALENLRFTGDVFAPLEGSIVYPHEPLIQVAAPLTHGQLVETALLNQIAYPTLTASKAARAVDAAQGAPVVEFGGRRAHGSDAALAASRASYIAGFAATSSVEAGRRYGVPITGTMAHSYVLASDDERDAFDAYVRQYPGTTLLVDTWGVRRGVASVIRVAEQRGADAIGAIRIDSGDLLEESVRAREQLDAAGLTDVRIVVSGGLDEYRIADLVKQGAPIDGFAAGTAIVAPPDAAALDAAYKLVEYDGRAVRKRSTGKTSLGGRKQVWRLPDRDLIAPVADPLPAHAEPLLRQVMSNGRRTPISDETLDRIRDRAAAGRGPRPVEIDPALLT